MKNDFVRLLAPALIFPALFSCTKSVKQKEDEIYSRHLQQHIKLTIISTPLPDNKKEMNLLLLNDGQDAEQLRVKKITDSLYKNKRIGPLLIVAIHAYDRMQEYGVAGYPDFQSRGIDAEKYDAFVADELYPYIKKQSGFRSFNSVVIAGCSTGGLSAFDIAWNHADRFDKVGVFSGSFWWRDKDLNNPDYSDQADRIIISKINTSRKRPKLSYWFYAGAKEETNDRDKDGIIDVIDDTKDLMSIIKNKHICPETALVYTENAAGKHDIASWSRVFPDFLLWAFGK